MVGWLVPTDGDEDEEARGMFMLFMLWRNKILWHINDFLLGDYTKAGNEYKKKLNVRILVLGLSSRSNPTVDLAPLPHFPSIDGTTLIVVCS